MDTRSRNVLFNPTDEQRHEALIQALKNAGRPEDYDYIIDSLSTPPDITYYAPAGALKDKRIGIIGGGLAGLSAAFELRKLGAEIMIIEASGDRIGGRVYTHYFDNENKYYGEFGAMRIPISHETTWYYINLLGLSTYPLTPPFRNNFLYVHNQRLRINDSIKDILYPYYDLTPSERNTPWRVLNEYVSEYPLLNLPAKIRAELLQIKPDYSPLLYPIMNMSVREYYEALGLSQGAISLLSGVNSLTGSLLNNSYDETLAEEYSLDFLNTYRINGGNVNLPLAFYKSFLSADLSKYYSIPPKDLGTVIYHNKHTVTGIYQTEDSDKITLLCQNKDTLPQAEQFDYVICTIPFSKLRQIEIKPLFSNMKMQAIMEYNYIDAQKTLFLCSPRFWEMDADYGRILGGISFTDLPIQSIIYPSDHNYCIPDMDCSPQDPGVLVASYNLNQNAVRLGGTNESQRFEVIKNNVEEVHGLPKGYLNTLLLNNKTVHWNSEPDFLGALAYSLPGQKPLFLYQMQQPEYNNKIFFAGEHISNKHGWMQGALYTGKKAANDLAYYSNQQR